MIAVPFFFLLFGLLEVALIFIMSTVLEHAVNEASRDIRTGRFQAGAGVNAPPSSYTVDGEQYIVVAAGGNAQLNFKRGNNIIAFTLAD